MALKYYNLISGVHDVLAIEASLANFIAGIENAIGEKLEPAEGEAFLKTSPKFVFVKSGGTESDFRKTLGPLDGPFYLITSDMHNSLPAALEILSYIRSAGKKGEILHAEPRIIAERIHAIKKASEAKRILSRAKLGVLGKPSDWLISSDVDGAYLKKRFGTDLVEIDIKELFSELKISHAINCSREGEIRRKSSERKGFDKTVLDGAFNVYESIKAICKRYELSGVSVRCFDMVTGIKNTGCLALALLNEEKIVAGCEGDMPALLSMTILNALSGKSSFMANPSIVEPKKNAVIFAHCTVSLDMAGNYRLDSHFESRLGVAICGDISKGPATVFKLAGSLNEYFVSGAAITTNPARENLCRTQIEVKLEKDVEYFLKRPLGNHHVICAGNYSSLVDEFFAQY